MRVKAYPHNNLLNVIICQSHYHYHYHYHPASIVRLYMYLYAGATLDLISSHLESPSPKHESHQVVGLKSAC